MIPVLYEKNESDFTGNGVGFLNDSINCIVTEERNGIYELTMQYPVSGQLYSKIKEGSIIKVKANETSTLQLFRIYKSSKPLKGIVSFFAEHISYTANGVPAAGLSIKAATPQMAMNKCCEEAILPHNFIAWSDISTLNNMEITTPCSLRAMLGGQKGSVLDVWGGEFEFDNFTIKLHANRGIETDIVIDYGKNLKDISQDINIMECYTHLFPFAKKTIQVTDDDGKIIETYEEVVYLSEKVLQIINVEEIGQDKALIMDFSEYFAEGEEVTESLLRTKANAYITTTNLGIPKVNIKVSFVQLWQTEEYKNIAPLERVRLCDTITVRFSALGVETKAKIIKTVYDSIKEKYNSVEIGDVKSSFADTLNKQNQEISNINNTINKGKAEATEALVNAIKNATNLITGHDGGAVVLNPAEKPQEILILDTPDIEEAVNVWRWNAGGLGYSKNGYNGPFELAMTMDGAIVADFIAAGILNGALLKADSVQSNAISQYYKTEVTNEIGEAKSAVEQAFVVADEQLMSLISNINTVLTGDIETVETTLSELKQTVDNLTFSFTSKYAGGINHIKNSSGLNGLSDDWTYTGNVIAQQTAEAINNTVSGSLFRLRTGTLKQEISVIKGKMYTLTFKARLATSSRCYVCIEYGGSVSYVFDKQATTNWADYSLTFYASSDSVSIIAATTGYYFYVADFMLVEGDLKSNWTPAVNEIYTENVKVDRKGINITNSESSTETVIDHTQFAIKHKSNVVLTVNKDLTELTKTEIKDELTIGKGKFVPNANGLDFVLLD